MHILRIKKTMLQEGVCPMLFAKRIGRQEDEGQKRRELRKRVEGKMRKEEEVHILKKVKKKSKKEKYKKQK